MISSAGAPPSVAAFTQHDVAPALLRINGLTRTYGQFQALRDASFSVLAGEVLGLIGPNGSGKTTLFECLAGVRPATRGEVLHHESPTSPDDRRKLLYYIPDGIRPWGAQTVRWVLGFSSGLHGIARHKQDAVVDALGIASLMDSRLSTLSKGEHKRVMLAIGLLTPQPLLLLDEPFDGLDLRQTRDVMELLRAESREGVGRTLFLSIHQLGDAARVCDRLILLSGGRIVGEGTLDELRALSKVHDGGLEEVFLALT